MCQGPAFPLGNQRLNSRVLTFPNEHKTLRYDAKDVQFLEKVVKIQLIQVLRPYNVTSGSRRRLNECWHKAANGFLQS